MLINILAFIIILNKLYYSLAIFQQSHYKIKIYTKYFISHFFYFNFFISNALIISQILDKTYYYLISYTVCIVYQLIFYYNLKLKLKITSRTKRTLIIIGVISLLLTNYIYVVLYEFLIIPLLLISILLENSINLYYVKKAKKKLEQYRGLKIAITGSYGKTSTKYFLGECLKDHRVSTYTKNSYNTPLGISLLINNNNIDIYDIYTFEMGASKKGDIAYLMDLIKPDITILTSIGYMHLDSFKSLKNIIKEKCLAIDMNKKGICILNYENEFIRNHKTNNIVISYGINYGDYRALNIDDNKNIRFDVYKLDKYFDSYDLNIVGRHNVLNVLAVIVMLDYLHIPKEGIKKSLENIKNNTNRLNVIRYRGSTILDDSFNSNIEGADSALSLLNNYEGLKILITPGFVEIKNIDDSYYKKYCNNINNTCDLVFLVGDKYSKKIYDNLSCKVYIFRSFKQAYKIFEKILEKEKCVLLIENDLPDIYMEGFNID